MCASLKKTAGLAEVAHSLVLAFDHVDIVALGEDHWRRVDSDLRIRIVRDPEFSRRAHFIVVEFASKAQQSTLDRYITGENVPMDQLQRVWKTTTQANGVWDSPVYAEFFRTVREVNGKLPPDSRIRVLAGDPPAASGISRDSSAVSVLKEQVLGKGGKALLIYGAAHLYRASLPDRTSISAILESDLPGRTFVVITQGGPYPEYKQFELALKTSDRPVLVSLQRPPFRDLPTEEFLGRDLKKRVNGHWVNAFHGSGLTLGQMADACVYFGTAQNVDDRVGPAGVEAHPESH